MTSEQALEALKEALKKELSDTCTSVSIFINSYETKITTSHRTAEQLKREGISMKNIKGEFIKSND